MPRGFSVCPLSGLLLSGFPFRILPFVLTVILMVFPTLVSMIYLTLSEATALTFLGPLGSLILTRFLSFATVRWTDYVGAAGAFLGVMLIAQPEGIFSTLKEVYTVSENTEKRLYGLGFGVFGFCGGVVSDEIQRFVKCSDCKLMSIILQIALTSIRRIGIRAHPLTSVNIFAWCLMILSGIVTIVTHEITWPKSLMVWGVLFYIGICGTLMVR